MDGKISITAQVDAATLELVDQGARERGISREEYAREAIELYSAEQFELLAFLREGEDAINCGEYLTHDELLADVVRWKRMRKYAA